METTPLWTHLTQAAGQPNAGGAGLWGWLKEKADLTQYRPQAAPGVVASRLSGREGVYFVLKNPQASAYYRLDERDYFLWQRMDGSHTVKDLVVAYFTQYGAFAFARVAALVQGLRARHFLSEPPIDVYQQARERLQRRTLGYRLNRVWRVFLSQEFAMRGIDRLLGVLYRWGGRLLFTRPAQALFLVIAVVGLAGFLRAFDAGEYNVITTNGSYILGAITLVLANLAAVFLHEMAHALAVKHYRREVRRAGFMLYFGLPAFFVDTTDIWLEDKRARLVVSWAGPYSGLILAGLAVIAITLWPGLAINALLFKFAALTYLSVFLNLNPLLELDGYFLLMDWLEIPMLRRKSLEFVRAGLWQKVRPSLVGRGRGWVRAALATFSREERIFSVFGLLAAGWTAYAIWSGAAFWQGQLAGAVRDLWMARGSAGQVVIALGVIAIGLLLVASIGMYLFGLARKGVAWLVRRGVFDNTWVVAGVLLAVVAALAALPGYLGRPGLLPPIGLASLALAAFFARRSAAHYAGSRLDGPFWQLMIFALVLLVKETGILAWEQGILPFEIFRPLDSVLGHSAPIVLLLVGLFLLADTDMKSLSAPEKGLLAVGLAATYLLVLAISRTYQGVSPFNADVLQAVGRALAPAVALTFLLPTFSTFWRTGFAPAWTALALALGGLLLAALAGLPPYWSYLLLAMALFLHHLAYRRVALLRDQPEPALGLSDEQRLQRAFDWTANAIYRQCREIIGARRARLLAGRLNNYTLAAGWRVVVVKGQVEGRLPEELTRIEQGRGYATVLTLLLDLVAEEMGEKLTVRVLQRAYDGLPWEEREVGAQYLFPHVERAETLSRAFQATRQNYQGLLRNMPLFATMDEAEINLLCACLRVEQYAAGQAIIRQGQAGARFYIVEWGAVELEARDERGVSQAVDRLERGDYFGEQALLQDVPHRVTARAALPAQALSLGRQDFDRLVKARFAVREKVGRSIAWADLLRQMPLFAELDGRQIHLLAAQLREATCAAGEIILRQGEAGDTFYVIVSGRVQASIEQDGERRAVAELGPGEYVGEVALQMQAPHTATVTALTPTSVLALRRADFERLVAGHLYVSRRLEREASRRMMDLRRTRSTP